MTTRENRLAIFDLDGTLLDTIGDLAEACNHMLRLRGLATHSREEYHKMVGNGILKLVERALPEHLRDAEYVMAAREDFLAYYVEHIDCYTRPYEGIREVLHTLQEEGWTLAVASNKFDSGTKQLVSSIFPEVEFTAVDSIGKKITVVREVASALGLTNVTPINARIEAVKGEFDYVVSRAEVAHWPARKPTQRNVGVEGWRPGRGARPCPPAL